jgi:hypothetical protein
LRLSSRSFSLSWYVKQRLNRTTPGTLNDETDHRTRSLNGQPRSDRASQIDPVQRVIFESRSQSRIQIKLEKPDDGPTREPADQTGRIAPRPR